MNDKTNFYVFEKKEIFLITVLVILVAITSFLFGLKIGSNYSFDDVGLTAADHNAISTKAEKVDLISSEEEKVAEIVNMKEGKDKSTGDINAKIEASLKQKMLEEFSNENKKFNNKKDIAPVEMKQVQQTTPIVEPVMDDTKVNEDNYSGKYTIQLASYRALSEAKEFAEGFKVLGFDPIVNEVELNGKGNWFRVSLGVFDDVTKAKEFVLKNKSVFAERDYVFFQFD